MLTTEQLEIMLFVLQYNISFEQETGGATQGCAIHIGLVCVWGGGCC